MGLEGKWKGKKLLKDQRGIYGNTENARNDDVEVVQGRFAPGALVMSIEARRV
jgi:hypothetical protein